MDASWHRIYVGAGTLGGHGRAERVAVVGAIRQQDLAGAEAAQHVDGDLPIMGLALRQLQENREAVGVDDGMEFGRQSASRAPHALGSSRVPSGGRRGLRTPLFDIAAVLVDADRGRVNHLQVAVVILRYRREDPVPHADLCQASEAVGAGRCRPVVLGDVGPGRTGPDTPIDAVQDLTVIDGTPRGLFGSSR